MEETVFEHLFSSPEPALLLISTKNHNPWVGPVRFRFSMALQNTIERDRNQSDLSDFTLSMRRVIGSSWIADFRCWTRSEVVILGADQKERDHCITSPKCCNFLWIYLKRKRDLYVTSQGNLSKVTFPRRLGNSSSLEKTPWNPGLPDV